MQNPKGVPLFKAKGLARHQTSRTEQVLLMLTIVLLPLQDHIPPIAGFSIPYIMFAALGGYIILNQPGALPAVIIHPLFLAAFALIGLGAFMEFIHPHTDFRVVSRIAQMFIGAILVASICRDEQSLRAGIYGHLAAGLALGALLCFTSYDDIAKASATNFHEASKIRKSAFEDTTIEMNLNTMALIIAQGAILGLALMLFAGSSYRRNVFLGITVLCLVGVSLPMSRAGIGIAFIGCASMVYTFGLKSGKTLLLAALIGGIVAMWIPDAVWSRMEFSTTANSRGNLEGRAEVYTTVIKHFPEYALTGVGAGNFWKKGFRGLDVGAHNVYFQVTLYWGLAGLIALLVLIWQAYRCLPRNCANNVFALCLLGISISLVMYSLVTHVLYSKQFSWG